MRLRRIGLTGNIASGKSTVARMLVARGAAHIDADAVVHRLYAPGTGTTRAIAEHFGVGVLGEDGGIDRGALGAIVFDSPEALKALETIVHPAAGAAYLAEIERVAAATIPPPAIVIEAVKLIESGRHEQMDELWFVVASPWVQKGRLMEHRGWSEREAEARLAAQAPVEPRLALADEVLRNDGSVADLEAEVARAWRRLTAQRQTSGERRGEA